MLNCQGQGRPVLQEFRKGAVLVNNFPDASGALDSLLSGTFCMKMLRAQGEGKSQDVHPCLCQGHAFV